MVVQKYTRTARVLHWAVAVLVIATLPVGGYMLTEGLARPTQDALFIFHKNVGVLILLLMLARLGWRLTHPAPPLPESVPPLQARIAGLTHWALYAAVLFMAFSGYVRVRAGGFPIEALDALGIPPLVPRSDSLAETAKAAHATARLVVIGLVAIHVGAALHHAILRKDGVFSRIWPPFAR
ncbi:cytochrome b [Halovulum dunhuangense]|uniref:Cytochrome b n=1 Tax=Halovulum dunhuangense TaxID=1505036 RepID=A0A849KVL6_9RHOB|nr:cytochrome b [Halovulum dunhuangense]NNU79448.1 cytochrome b [Halovulum dunhuangense]